jgi:predicted RNA-binding Zn-ribbon protein involved in translation (DUF1610 family)
MTIYQDCTMTFETKSQLVSAPQADEEMPQKSVMTCPSCGNTAIEIVSRCATCRICGWSVCSV